MARKSNWNDDYWLYVMQLYMRRPTGVKPLYAKAAVDLSLELHIHPKETLARQMDIETLSTPRIERIWDEYGDNPRKLSRAVRLLRSMKGFGSADEFYEGVETIESFERDFRPVNDSGLQPIALVLILDLYFRLTPLTMVSETPEVIHLARLIDQPASTVVHVLTIYLHLDPFISRQSVSSDDPLLPHCKKVWNTYGNLKPEQLCQLAEEIMVYYMR